MPPRPDVPLSVLKPTRSVGFGHTYGGEVRYSGNTRSPQTDRANLGGPLRINRTTYARGLGVHAPCEVVYELKPEFRRFVALAGADENLIEVSNGSNLAQFPSVVFKVLIDGNEAAVSPVMRVKTDAWRFDVPIPAGSRRLSLVAMDAGDGSREDFADWAEAGFVVSQ
jgi:endo-alpha-N-acetylgalactosaminidase